MIVPEAEWRWFGSPGHFIGAFDCRFHLCTQVGPWLVSTVGEYFPDSAMREILAESRGVKLVGKGDARERDYRNKIGFEEIGCGRTFETMVFRAGAPCARPDCRCGLPEIDGDNKDFDGYSDKAAAAAGHLEMCRKYAGIPAAVESENGASVLG